MKNSKIAVVLIRGLVNVPHTKKKTLEYLRLKQKHSCCVLDDNEVNRGMINKVRDYITFGEIDEKTYLTMLEKRGELIGKKKANEDKKVNLKEISEKYFKGELKLREMSLKYNLKPFFRLHPPIGGFEKKGIKAPFTKGGVLGNRSEQIKDLINKML